MELFSFDFRSWMVAVFLFFSGCIANRPPDPVVITAPKTTSRIRTIGSDELWMTVTFDQYGNMYVSQKTIDKTNEGKKITTKELDQEIKKVKQEAADQNKKLTVRLRTQLHLSNEKFQWLTKELRRNGIYSFQLLTTPD